MPRSLVHESGEGAEQAVRDTIEFVHDLCGAAAAAAGEASGADDEEVDATAAAAGEASGAAAVGESSGVVADDSASQYNTPPGSPGNSPISSAAPAVEDEERSTTPDVVARVPTPAVEDEERPTTPDVVDRVIVRVPETPTIGRLPTPDMAAAVRNAIMLMGHLNAAQPTVPQTPFCTPASAAIAVPLLEDDTEMFSSPAAAAAAAADQPCPGIAPFFSPKRGIKRAMVDHNAEDSDTDDRHEGTAALAQVVLQAPVPKRARRLDYSESEEMERQRAEDRAAAERAADLAADAQQLAEAQLVAQPEELVPTTPPVVRAEAQPAEAQPAEAQPAEAQPATAAPQLKYLFKGALVQSVHTGDICVVVDVNTATSKIMIVNYRDVCLLFNESIDVIVRHAKEVTMFCVVPVIPSKKESVVLVTEGAFAGCTGNVQGVYDAEKKITSLWPTCHPNETMLVSHTSLVPISSRYLELQQIEYEHSVTCKCSRAGANKQ